MRRSSLGFSVLLVACGGSDGRDAGSATGVATTGIGTASAAGSMTGGVASESDSATRGDEDSSGSEQKFDLGGQPDIGLPPGTPSCTVVDDMNAVGECEESAPPDSFEPDIQWTWTGPDPNLFSIVTPLVANLTDDDGSGTIDLCDIPDVVVVASSSSGSPSTAGTIYVLDGETGTLQFAIAQAVDHSVTPAIGDIDADGLPEIVTALVGGGLVAFQHDGTTAWMASTGWGAAYSGAIALADLDEDGDVEIIAGNIVADHLGTTLWTAPQPAGNWSATTAADLDGQPGLEVVLGHAAYHADGSEYYVNSGISPGYPQVANLDDDPDPEVLVTNINGLNLLEHDGTTVFSGSRPTGDGAGSTTWLRPATIHDFDGDGIAEFAVSSANHYTVYDRTGTIRWTADVSDQSGIAAGTAFDFLGDGGAEAMYADENDMFIFDDVGQPILQIPRTSGTLSEYPVVADIDNDGSAEIVVVSNNYGAKPSPTVQVIRDVDDRWIQARRIWNQHTYHVTNVREDGTIPAVEPKSWSQLNTFRTNAQIEGGGLCIPPPEG